MRQCTARARPINPTVVHADSLQGDRLGLIQERCVTRLARGFPRETSVTIEPSRLSRGRTDDRPLRTGSFKVRSAPVRTNGSTQFKDTSCASLKAGDAVEV